MDDANRWIAPVLGLPELPFVDFGDALLQDRPDGVCQQRPVVLAGLGEAQPWVDDHLGEVDPGGHHDDHLVFDFLDDLALVVVVGQVVHARGLPAPVAWFGPRPAPF